MELTNRIIYTVKFWNCLTLRWNIYVVIYAKSPNRKLTPIRKHSHARTHTHTHDANRFVFIVRFALIRFVWVIGEKARQWICKLRFHEYGTSNANHLFARCLKRWNDKGDKEEWNEKIQQNVNVHKKCLPEAIWYCTDLSFSCDFFFFVWCVLVTLWR